MLELGTTVGVLKDANIEATKASAQIVAGRIISENITKMIKPKLPMIARGYVEEPLYNGLLMNALAGIIIATMPEDKNAALIANSLIVSSNLDIMESFNIQDLISNALEGVNTDSIIKVQNKTENE